MRQAPDLTRVYPQVLDQGSTSKIYLWSKSQISNLKLVLSEAEVSQIDRLAWVFFREIFLGQRYRSRRNFPSQNKQPQP
ncbi:hypothetical protein QT970_09830 [Microcoleus sp. herbarium8]|uniref:hypothetical protein n=1 Tax=Microcoleus sp. herbarium8 TaxID=3055436 RepID=UPI002FCF875D